MSTTMQLSDLITAVRQRAGMENSQFVTDAEITSYINQSYFELYDLLVQKYGDNYYVAPPLSIPTDGVNNLYALPDGTLYSSAPACLKLLGIEIQVGIAPNSWINVRRINFSQRNRYASPNVQALVGITNLGYDLLGSNIYFAPLPAGGQTFRLWYIPRMTTLVSGTDTVDGISGWTEYIIIDGTIKCRQKQEDDVSVYLAQKQAMIQRIEAAASNRDAANPSTVSDTQGDGSGYDGCGSGWWY